MIKGKLKNGFEFKIDEKKLDDYRYLELISEAEENPALIPKAVKFALGEEQKDRLLNFLEDEKGRVPTIKMELALKEIFTKANEKSKTAKN